MRSGGALIMPLYQVECTIGVRLDKWSEMHDSRRDFTVIFKFAEISRQSNSNTKFSHISQQQQLELHKSSTKTINKHQNKDHVAEINHHPSTTAPADGGSGSGPSPQTDRGKKTSDSFDQFALTEAGRDRMTMLFVAGVKLSVSFSFFLATAESLEDRTHPGRG